MTEIRCLNWACLSDRQRNIYYRNVYHCYQFVLASIYINIYFVLASAVQCFGIFRPFHISEDPIKLNFLQGQNTGIPVLPVYFSGIPIPEFSHTEHPYCVLSHAISHAAGRGLDLTNHSM